MMNFMENNLQYATRDLKCSYYLSDSLPSSSSEMHPPTHKRCKIKMKKDRPGQVKWRNWKSYTAGVNA